MDTLRTTLATTHHGLDRRCYPMRLWEKAKRWGIWNPSELDFEQDRADWQRLDERERDLLLRLTAQFAGGEESVTIDLLPLLGVMAQEGRIEEELFLTSYLWEEAKHVDAFGRFLEEVVGVTGGLEDYFTDAYRRLFFEEQPRALQRLRVDASPLALAEASVTYQMITEGVLAETGYHAYYTVLQKAGMMPGMQQLVRLVQRDESRHIGYGIFLLSRLVAEHGEPLWEVIEARMTHLLSLPIQHIEETLAPYGTSIPFGVRADDFLSFGMAQFQKRYARIEKARRLTLDEVCYGAADGGVADGAGEET
ncbi:MAG: R2-like ligand-binding oxidase [Bacteroidetes bacterium]|nr:MAG: R2-like ligand-binding oxidase [Bacteroidota bacterium]